MQEKIVEFKTKDTWLFVNASNIKCVEVLRNKVPFHDSYNMIVMYYGDEDDLVIDGKFTEEECSTFKYKLCN